MKNLIRKILREQIDREGTLSKYEITFLKLLHKAGYTDRSVRQEIMPYLFKMGVTGIDAFHMFELFKNNYNPSGDYTSIVDPKRDDIRNKKYASPNSRARDLVMSKIPFKGSNTDGKYVNGKYVVSSYEWYPIFVFHNNQWYQIDNGYSMSTKKQMSQLRPYDQGNIIDVSKDEIWEIIRS